MAQKGRVEYRPGAVRVVVVGVADLGAVVATPPGRVAPLAAEVGFELVQGWKEGSRVAQHSLLPQHFETL